MSARHSAAGEADQLRHAMATFKHVGGVSKFGEKLISGMVANVLERPFRELLFIVYLKSRVFTLMASRCR